MCNWAGAYEGTLTLIAIYSYLLGTRARSGLINIRPRPYVFGSCHLLIASYALH